MPGERIDDRTYLAILDLWSDGLAAAAIAKRFGMSRSAVCGLIHRADMTAPPDRFDGTLPPRWWEAGLARRDASASRGAP